MGQYPSQYPSPDQRPTGTSMSESARIEYPRQAIRVHIRVRHIPVKFIRVMYARPGQVYSGRHRAGPQAGGHVNRHVTRHVTHPTTRRPAPPRRRRAGR